MEKMEIITIPDGQTAIAKGAFRWRRSIYSVIMPDSVTSIGKSAFSECINLEDIIIPDNVKNIENYAFYNCKKLQNITMSGNVESIGDYAFYGCKNLTGIILPDSVTNIGHYAFSWCKKLTVFCSESQKLVEAYCRKSKIKLQFINPAQHTQPEIISKITEAPALSGKGIADISDITDIEKKINAFICEIDLFINSIADSDISKELTGIKNVLDKIIDLLKEKKYIENHSKRLEEFFSYYFPTVKKILDAYRQIETHSLNGKNAAETKQRIAESIPFIRKAFEKELDNMYQNKMFDITTDIDALESMFAKDGLLDINPFEIKKI
ncbi:MAG: leucine-rich repeat protein [Oscillospiraceae bacterium]|nr:leucine-rich repeat protein [Oscillospiraceae bacterium]